MSATDNEQNAGEVPESVEEGVNVGVVDVQIRLPNKTIISIPSVYAGESLASVRQILLEYQESAALTNYSFQLRKLINQQGEASEVDVACNDFTEIGTIVEPSIATCVFDVVNAEYNVKKVQDQIKRTNELLQNPPSTKGAVTTQAAADSKNKKKADAAAQASAEAKSAAANPALPKTDDLFKPIDLGNFYGEVLYRTGDVEAVAKSARMPTNKAVLEGVKSIFASGWNPVPPQRKLRGDLLYIEVVTSNEGTLYITAVPAGFYLNKSNRSHFDPNPATNHCFSHELLDTLLKASPTLQTAWNGVAQSGMNVNSVAVVEDPATPLDVMAWLFSQGRGNQTSEQGLAKPQWNAYNVDAYKHFLEGTEASARPSENAHHSYNLFRTQQEIANLQGVEELGAPREWNDEIQSIRALKATNVSDKIMKTKLEYKVITEFAAACRTSAVAITEGLIAPLSLGDPGQSEIYVYNGIFFSKAEDSKDSFKICNGDEAYKKSISRELQNQRVIRALEIEGVGMILCATVDYKGQRIIGQSIIPGIFAQGENQAKLMYGILDKEKILTVKNSSLKIMQEVCEKLYIPQRNPKLYPFGEPTPAAAAEEVKVGMLDETQSSPIKVDEADNVVDNRSPSTPHCGPIEAKVLQGSDGRNYLLEMMRLTPRDANYVAGEKGTGKVALLEKSDKDLAVTYVLRPELVSLFVQRKIQMERQKVMGEASAAQKKLIEEKKAALAAAGSAEKKAVEGEAPAPEVALDEETMQKLSSEYSAKMKDITVASLNLSLNPNCFLDFEFDVDAEVVKRDEAVARELAAFLWDVVLPAATKQVRDGDIQVKDNVAMVKLLHRNGVNVRYLGALATAAAAEEKEDEDLLAQGKQKVHAMPLYWREMVTVEIIARAVKYVLNDYYKSAGVSAAPAQTIASTLNHVLSLLVPAEVAPVAAATETAAAQGSKGKKNKKGGKAEPAVATPVISATAAKVEDKLPFLAVADAASSKDACLQLVQQTIATRFCFDLPLVGDASADTKIFLQTRLSAVALLRRICQVCGIQIATRKYNFAAANPFSAADVLSLVPVVKTCEPEVLLSEFHEMMESTVSFEQEGNHAYAYEMAQQALSTITQITGPYHQHASQALDQVTNVLIAAGDYAAAQQFAQKGLAVSVQLHGFDSQESAMHHVKMGVLETELGNTASATQHLLTAKYLVQLMTGERHTELASVYARLATLYDLAGDFDSVWQCYIKAKFHTTDLMQICALNISLAAICARNKHMMEALEMQRQAYSMLKELLGDRDDAQLDDVKNTLEQYLRAVNEQKNATYSQMTERLEEMTAKLGKAKLVAAESGATPAAAVPLSDQELLDSWAEIDARAEKEKKKAKNAAKKSKAKK